MNTIRFYQQPAWNAIIDELFGNIEKDNIKTRDCGCIPATNIIESTEQFEIQMALPGIDKSKVKIALENEMMQVTFEQEEQQSENKYLRREFAQKSFERSFSLPKTIDLNKINADYTNGILSITIPKKENEIQKIQREIKIQ